MHPLLVQQLAADHVNDMIAAAAGSCPDVLVGPQRWVAGRGDEEMRTVERIRFHRPRVRHERPWHGVLPPGPRDPDVVRAKAVAPTSPRPRGPRRSDGGTSDEPQHVGAAGPRLD